MRAVSSSWAVMTFRRTCRSPSRRRGLPLLPPRRQLNFRRMCSSHPPCMVGLRARWSRPGGRKMETVSRNAAQDRRDHVQSVDRALTVLQALAVKGSPMSLAVLERELGLHKSIVFRLLRTLESRGFVERDAETGWFQLGL